MQGEHRPSDWTEPDTDAIVIGGIERVLQKTALFSTPLRTPRLVQIDQPMEAIKKQALELVLGTVSLPGLCVRRLPIHITTTNIIGRALQLRQTATPEHAF